MIRKNVLASFCLVLITISACKKSSTVPNDTGIDLNLTPTEQQLAVANNSFSLKLFKTLATSNTDGNLLVSPLSVCFAVGMVNNGSNGQTLSAINNATNVSGFTQSQVNTYYNKLITDLPKLDPTTTLNVANSIWYNQNISVLPQFLQTNSSSYQAKLQAVDFGLPTTKDMMNQWVSDQTHGKIPGIITGTSPSDVMYLINAIYFKSTWNERFDPTETHQKAFYLPNNTTIQTDFMSADIHYNTYSDDLAQVYELPYKNKKYSMVIVMPVNTKTVQDVTGSLDSVKWQSWMSQLQPAKNIIVMPKFKFQYQTGLNNQLTALGMGIAFTKNADFTRINTAGGMLISSVMHKTYIEVNEDGTEAAAVTSIGVSSTSLPVTITIDHPFIFAIREMKTGLILFTGIVNNPQLTPN